jgi:hypothetical protein
LGGKLSLALFQMQIEPYTIPALTTPVQLQAEAFFSKMLAKLIKILYWSYDHGIPSTIRNYQKESVKRIFNNNT